MRWTVKGLDEHESGEDPLKLLLASAGITNSSIQAALAFSLA